MLRAYHNRILANFQIAQRCLKTFSTSTSVSSEDSSSSVNPSGVKYKVEEVQITKLDGHLAGKLWQAEPAPGCVKQYSPIVCLHGWLDNCGSFDPLIPLIIKPGMQVLAVDHPGHGYSSHTTSTHYDTVIDCYYGMVKTLKQFGWTKVTILGHSMGAIAGYSFSGLFPEYVDRYIALENLRPIPGSDPVILMRKAADILLSVEKKLNKRLPPPSYTYDEILEKTYLGRGKSINLEGCKILLKRGAARLPDGRYSFTHDLRVTVPTALGKFSDSQTLDIGAAIRCPVCVIKAEPGNDYELREKFMQTVDHISKTAPLVEFHSVPGTHHFHLNDPHLVAPIINDFLEV